MAEHRNDREGQDETQSPEHSPVEEEFASHDPGAPAPRDGIMIAGFSFGVIFAAIAILFVIGVVVALIVA